MKTGKGLTLMELIIVLASLGIISLIAMPNIFGKLPDYRIKSAGKEIASQLLLTRMKAISRNCSYGILFKTDERSYAVWRNDPGPISIPASPILVNP